jgi:hypothetical protein
MLMQSEATLLELLRRLQQLELTVDTLTVTEIGKAVSSYRKHNSKQIRHLVRLLIEYGHVFPSRLGLFIFKSNLFFLASCIR